MNRDFKASLIKTKYEKDFDRHRSSGNFVDSHIDGKPNPMFSGNPSQIFKMMPASAVKGIQVITNPGVKYDAEGVGGVLNIEMARLEDGSKASTDGYYGSVRLTGGNRGYGGGLFFYQKFLEAAERASNWFRIRESAPNTSLPTSIFIKADGNMRRVEFSDILYITGMKDYVSIRLASQRLPLITHITMKAVEDMLPSDSFMRIHRSCIVALGKIESVTPALDLTIAGTVFHVSDQYATLFRAWLETNSLCK